MRILKHRLFIGMLLLGVIIYVLQRLGIVLPSFVNNYVNDLLAVPLTAWLTLAVLKQWKGYTFLLSPLMIMTIVFYFSVYFEWYLPQHNPRYTGDFIDVLCYIAGGIAFYFIQKKYIPSSKK